MTPAALTASPQQWHNVRTETSSALSASQLTSTMRFTGPQFLHKPLWSDPQESSTVVGPETDGDVRPLKADIDA